MIRFYDVDSDYIEYLKKFDHQIPSVKYSSNNKFVCGVVLHIEGHNYFAPISSNKQRQRTSMLIYDKRGRCLSSIRFSFMFPAKFSELQMKDFSQIRLQDANYANLLLSEYKFCREHETEILEKAKSVYRIGCNPKHKLNAMCCNFKKLEEVYTLYNTSNAPYKV